MYWKISQFPELRCLEPHERHRLLAAIPLSTYLLLFTRTIALSILSTIPFAIATIYLLGVETPSFFPLLFAVLLLSAPLFYCLQLNTIRQTLREEIHLSFQGQRPPFCFTCGYDTRNLSTLQCPECGALLPQ